MFETHSKSAPDLSGVRKVLIIRIDKVGDLLLSTPAIRCIREALPGARIDLLAAPYNSAVLAGWDALDNILVYDRKWPESEKRAFTSKLRQEKYDLCVVLSPLTEAYFVAYATRARIRAGLVYATRIVPRMLSPILLTHPLILNIDKAVSAGGAVPHEVRQMLQLVAMLGMKAPEVPLEVPLSNADKDWARAFVSERCPDRPLIGIHLSFKWLTGGWTAVDLVMMMYSILDDIPGSCFLITFGPADFDPAGRLSAFVSVLKYRNGNLSVMESSAYRDTDKRLRKLVEKRTLMVGDLPFGYWTGLLSCCDLILSPDTGSLHLGVALGKPVVAIYEKKTFNHCSQQWEPWKVPHRSIRKDDYDVIGPQILEATKELLGISETKTESGTEPTIPT
jgi:ADP-heptose:LPS heptosyltransferase